MKNAETVEIPAPLYGWLAEFARADAAVAAARQLHGQHYRLQAFTPFPVEELEPFLPPEPNPIPRLMLLGGIVGAVLGYAVQYYSAVWAYPMLVGGKPMHAWPAFIPVSFELAILFAALAGFLGVLWSNGLPRLHHPVFDAQAFDLASRDRFFLLLAADDPAFDRERSRADLQALAPARIHPVPAPTQEGAA